MNPVQLEFGQELIETVVITPTKEMPLDVFAVCHRLAHYMECMPRADDSHVLWEAGREEVYCESLALAEYEALRRDWYVCSMELPRAFVESVLGSVVE